MLAHTGCSRRGLECLEDKQSTHNATRSRQKNVHIYIYFEKNMFMFI